MATITVDGKSYDLNENHVKVMAFLQEAIALGDADVISSSCRSKSPPLLRVTSSSSWRSSPSSTMISRSLLKLRIMLLRTSSERNSQTSLDHWMPRNWTVYTELLISSRSLPWESPSLLLSLAASTSSPHLRTTITRRLRLSWRKNSTLRSPRSIRRDSHSWTDWYSSWIIICSQIHSIYWTETSIQNDGILDIKTLKE